MKRFWISIVAVVGVVVAIAFTVLRHEGLSSVEVQSVKSATVVTSPSPKSSAVITKFEPPVQTTEMANTRLEASATNRDLKPELKKNTPVNKPANMKEPIQDPEARRALAFVGEDPYAELYWVAAINNPALSAHERQDLIEDLNEDGLSDPKHPGPEDLPLILSRIELIEELAPFAMDQVNADAFAEAYKDLINILDGVPVR